VAKIKRLIFGIIIALYKLEKNEEVRMTGYIIFHGLFQETDLKNKGKGIGKEREEGIRMEKGK
jgi:hypothetical protein